MTLNMEFPDAEATVAWAIREANIPDLEGVYSSIPAKAFTDDGPQVVVVVTRIGGAPEESHSLDNPNLSISTWATTKSVAHDVAQAARAVVHDLSGTTVGVEDDGAPVACTIAGVRDSMGMASIPDPNSKKDRYTFGVRLWTRTPAAGAYDPGSS